MKSEFSASTAVATSELSVDGTFGSFCFSPILLSLSLSLRRTADVRAVGYAELFVLSREDVLSALADHPDAHVSALEIF